MITSRAGDAGGGWALGRGVLQDGRLASPEFPISSLTQPRFGAKINFTTLKFLSQAEVSLATKIVRQAALESANSELA